MLNWLNPTLPLGVDELLEQMQMVIHLQMLLPLCFCHSLLFCFLAPFIELFPNFFLDCFQKIWSVSSCNAVVRHRCEQTSLCCFHLLFAHALFLPPPSLLQEAFQVETQISTLLLLGVCGLWVFTYRESLVGAILKTEQGWNRRNSALPWDTRDTGGCTMGRGWLN